jgi:hypothetical protein
MSFDPISLFPFKCQNPECPAVYDEEQFKELYFRRGLVYAECEDHIYIGISCEKCNGTSVTPLPRDQRILDLREFIAMADLSFNREVGQQILEYEHRAEKNEFLHFQFTPAWDHHAISPEILKIIFGPNAKSILDGQIWYCPSRQDLEWSTESIPHLITSRLDLERRLSKESLYGEMALKRMFPISSVLGLLMRCLSHPKIAHLYESSLEDKPEDRIIQGDHDLVLNLDAGETSNYTAIVNTREERNLRNTWWRDALEGMAGESFRETSIRLLKERGIGDLDDSRFEEILASCLEEIHGKKTERIHWLFTKIGFEKEIENRIRSLFIETRNKVCTELALDPSRKKLHDWVTRVQKGKALLVDAPMGLGKTYSITESLAEKEKLSAVVFMPTLRMCEEVVEQIKTKIAKKRGTYLRDRLTAGNIEDAKGVDGDVLIGNDGLPIVKWTRDFLEDQVYLVDGINKDECPYFGKIINSYKSRTPWKKKDFCRKCEKLRNEACRFVNHDKLAKRARIVVTTHAQYDKFFNKTELHGWHHLNDKFGAEVRRAKKRNLFIIDEDMVLTNCYQPEAVDFVILEAFVKDFCDFLGDFDGTSEIIQRIETFLGRVTRCEENTILPPIDRKFTIPDEIAARWKEELTVEYDLQHSETGEVNVSPDLSERLAHAIRVGASVEKFDQYNAPYGERFRIHFANPRQYDLSKVPPHVFFDGTMLEEEFLKKKLKNVAFEKLKIKVEPLWKLKVHQNIYSDLPKKTLKYDRPYVETFVTDLVHTLEQREESAHKYFFLTNKHTREAYLESFIRRAFPGIKPVLCHYRYMKGINDAKECDIGIMLGSYVMPISAEVAMALEFIQKQLLKKGKNIRLDETFSWKGGNARRVFKEEWAVVGRLADSLRLSEHRQGIARTRYIFHDVELYALSKDPINEYEDLAEIETDHFRTDLFSRQERSDSQYLTFKADVFKWLSNHDHARVTDIRKAAGLGRRIARKHLYRMVDEQLLRKSKHGREFWYTKADTIS